MKKALLILLIFGWTSPSFGKNGTILLFVASHCPCSDPHRLLVQSLFKEYQSKGVQFYAVFSNKEENKELASRFMKQTGWIFPWLIDHDGKIKERFDAKVTPEAFLIDEKEKIIYRGAIDDSIFNNIDLINLSGWDNPELIISS